MILVPKLQNAIFLATFLPTLEKRNLLQVAERCRTHVTRCNLELQPATVSKNSCNLLSSTLCNRCKLKKVARQVAKA